jgi:hypothetical protein
MADIMASYNADTSRLDERALEIILGWLKAQL